MFEGFLSPMHLLIVGVLAILLFGDRLPEVMRSLGKGMSEFKKGMQGIQSTMNVNLDASSQRASVGYKDDRDEPATPRFQPPTSEPRAEHDSHDSADHASDDHASSDHALADHSPAEHSASEQATGHSSQPSAAQHSP
jgi:sec-independent protein translocase protein TatA